MDFDPQATAFDRGVYPLLSQVLTGKTDEVRKFRPERSLQERIEQLASKSTEGELTDEEREEYAGYVQANKFVAVMKRQAERLTRSDG